MNRPDSKSRQKKNRVTSCVVRDTLSLEPEHKEREHAVACQRGRVSNKMKENVKNVQHLIEEGNSEL
jgi:hypothetical protein